MGQFVVSARKYRPSSFDKLIGQDNIAKTLKNSILAGQLAHAYLFCGPRGVGKTSSARIFAKTINCSNPGAEMEPCGECESCRSFAEGRSYCIHELDAASNNSVDDIRNLTDQVRIPPQIGKYSVYIIDEVHMLSQAAFNAFLKTLEEPPAHAIFILATTEKHKILPTILSRCQTYDFNRIGIEDIVRNLKGIAAIENISISDDALHILAQKADGAMRDALTLFDQTVAFCGNDITYEQVIGNLGVLDYDYFFRLTDMFLAGDYAQCLLLFDEILSKGFNALHFITGLSSHFRDLIVCKNATSRGLLEMPPSVAARYDEYAAKCHIGFLYEALGISTSCEAGYKSSSNPRLLIEFTLIRIAQLYKPLAVDHTVTAPQAAPAAPAPQPAAQPAPAPAAVPSAAPTASAASPAATPAPAPPKAQPAPSLAASAAAKKAEPAPLSTPKSATSISIKNLMAKAEAEQNVQTAAPIEIELADVAPAAPVTQEDVEKAWKEVIAEMGDYYEDSPARIRRIQEGFEKHVPQYNAEEGKIIQYVDNANQRNFALKNLLTGFQTLYRAKLSNPSLTVEIEIAPSETVEAKPYMPREKAKVMMDNSPELVTLAQEFELEVS